MEEILVSVRKYIDELLDCQEQAIVAIDGNCTAGKSTLAAMLKSEYDCNVFHLDDFFLRPEQRTPERYAQPGGNVDYERFQAEVLNPLLQGNRFSYRPFSCKTFTLAQPVEVTPKKLTIIEGTYSLHPYFGDIFDFKIFMAIDPQRQRNRILERPQGLHETFFNQWIPMEQAYFEHFHIADKCDVIYR